MNTLARRPPVAACLILLLGAPLACTRRTIDAPLDVLGSTLAVEPANIAAHAAAAATVTVQLRRQSGSAVSQTGRGNLKVRLAIPGCAAPSTWSDVDADGKAVVSVGDCDIGQHSIAAEVQVDGAYLQLAATSQILAFATQNATADALPAGVRANLSALLPEDYVGWVRFECSDPLAQLPESIDVAAHSRGVLMLPGQLVLMTPGPQTLRWIDAVSGRVLVEQHFTVTGSLPPTGVPVVPHPPPTSTTSTLDPSAVTFVADGVDSVAMNLTLRNAQGAALGNATVTVTSTGSQNVLTPASATTASDGTLQISLASTRAEAKLVRATYAGAVVASTLVVGLSGPADATTSSLTVSPTTLVADAQSTATVTLTLRDAHGNPIPGANAILTAIGSDNVFTPSIGPTAPDGTLVATYRTTQTTTKTLIASICGSPICGDPIATTTLTVVAPAGDPAQSSFTASAGTVVANGTDTVTLTLTLRTSHGAPLSGVAVTFSSSGSGNTLTPASGTTASDGTLATSYATTRAGPKIVTATINGSAFATRSITAEAGAPDASNSYLTTDNATPVADGATPLRLTANVRDGEGNGVAGMAVTFTSSNVGDTVSPTSPGSTTTDSTGAASVNVISSVAESKTLTADVTNAFSLTTPTHFFAVSAASALHSTFTALPGSLSADGTVRSTLVATLRDSSSAPIVGAKVRFLSSEPRDFLLTQAIGVTDGTGAFTSHIAPTYGGARTVTMVSDSLRMTAPVTLSIPACTGTVFLSPTAVTTDAAAAATAGVAVGDFNEDGKLDLVNMIPGTGATFLAGDGAGHFAAPVTIAASTSTPDVSGAGPWTSTSTATWIWC